eukprot:Nk52_evm12s241 gene=Nk52_evmTU12s241
MKENPMHDDQKSKQQKEAALHELFAYLPYRSVPQEVRLLMGDVLYLIMVNVDAVILCVPHKVGEMWFGLSAGFGCLLLDPTREEAYYTFGRRSAVALEEPLSETLLLFCGELYSQLVKPTKQNMVRQNIALLESMGKNGGPMSISKAPRGLDDFNISNGTCSPRKLLSSSLLFLRAQFKHFTTIAALPVGASDEDKLAFNTGKHKVLKGSDCIVTKGTMPCLQLGLTAIHNCDLQSIPFEEESVRKVFSAFLEMNYIMFSKEIGDHLSCWYNRFAEEHSQNFEQALLLRNENDPCTLFSAKEWAQKSFGVRHLSLESTFIFKSYELGKYFSFGNSNVPRCTLVFGTTHVSIGFVDFHELMWVNFCSPDEFGKPIRRSIEQLGALAEIPQTIRYVGVDKSSYSCAKSIVLKHLLEAPFEFFASIGIDECEYAQCIFQIWFSSVWSVKSRKVFQKIVKMIIEKNVCEKTNSCSGEVKSILSHWNSAQTVPFQRAIKEWRALMPAERFIGAMNVRDEKDAVEGLRYLTTGQVCPGEEGSICMFENPSLGQRGDMEIFYSIILATDLLTERQTSKSIIEAASSLLIRRIRSLRENVQRGIFELEVEMQQIHSGSERYIAEFKPATVSWSNVIDYMYPNEFHKVAKGCSIENEVTGISTVHYLYSMNWTIGYKGAYIIDYDKPKQIDKIFTLALEHYAKVYKTTGWDKYLISPPIFPPLFLPSNYLSSVRNSHVAWIRHILKPMDAQLHAMNVAYGMVSETEFNALHNTRADKSIALVIVYDNQTKVDVCSLIPNSKVFTKQL